MGPPSILTSFNIFFRRAACACAWVEDDGGGVDIKMLSERLSASTEVGSLYEDSEGEGENWVKVRTSRKRVASFMEP